MNLPVATSDAIALNQIAEELVRARGLHKPLNSAHEAYAVILEEVDELWDEVRKRGNRRDRESMRLELVQIGAMCARALTDLRLVSLP